MMAVHIKVSLYPEGKIKQSMSGKAVQHMVKETDSRRDIGFAASVNNKRQTDTGFLRYSFNICLAAHSESSSDFSNRTRMEFA